MHGDQFFVDLDLSEANLPIGSRLRVGDAEVVVSAKEHNGCGKFEQRFGRSALDFVNDYSGGLGRVNHRGIYWTCIRDGEVKPGSSIEVISRSDPVEKLTCT